MSSKPAWAIQATKIGYQSEILSLKQQQQKQQQNQAMLLAQIYFEEEFRIQLSRATLLLRYRPEAAMFLWKRHLTLPILFTFSNQLSSVLRRGPLPVTFARAWGGVCEVSECTWPLGLPGYALQHGFLSCLNAWRPCFPGTARSKGKRRVSPVQLVSLRIESNEKTTLRHGRKEIIRCFTAYISGCLCEQFLFYLMMSLE